MLGRDCLKALFGKQFPPPLNWVKSGFSWICRNGFQVSAKVGFDAFWPTLAPQTHFWTHFSPLLKTHLKPTLSGNKLFPQKGALRQPWPSITQAMDADRKAAALRISLIPDGALPAAQGASVLLQLFWLVNVLARWSREWGSNFDPHPWTSLVRISRMEILTKENLIGAKSCSHCSFQDFHTLTKGNHVSLVVRIHFSHNQNQSPPQGAGKLVTREKIVENILENFWRFLTFVDVAPFRWPLLRSADRIRWKIGRRWGWGSNRDPGSIAKWSQQWLSIRAPWKMQVCRAATASVA